MNAGDVKHSGSAFMLARLKELGGMVSASLADYPLPATPGLKAAMLYSLGAGGKRLRPALCLAWAKASGCPERLAVPFACAIEMIHTYSLIHDDLPAMDNDDMRRGKPSSHKAFGEATAILAGDGLLTDAFWLALTTSLPPARVVAATRILAFAAGTAGMAGGQMEDMELTGATPALAEVERMQAKKTGALIAASCVCGVILGGGSKAMIQAAAVYGKALGAAFQIMDDILDITGETATLGKPVGSDEAAGKPTWPSVAGLEKSKIQAQRKVAEAIAALGPAPDCEKGFFEELAHYVIKRSA